MSGLQKNLIDFGMYITMFPQLIAGPIVRYARCQRCSLPSAASLRLPSFSEGIMRLLLSASAKRCCCPMYLRRLRTPCGRKYTHSDGDVSALMAWTGAISVYASRYILTFPAIRIWLSVSAGCSASSSPKTSTIRTSVRVDHRVLAQLAHHAEHLVHATISTSRSAATAAASPVTAHLQPA